MLSFPALYAQTDPTPAPVAPIPKAKRIRFNSKLCLKISLWACVLQMPFVAYWVASTFGWFLRAVIGKVEFNTLIGLYYVFVGLAVVGLASSCLAMWSSPPQSNRQLVAWFVACLQTAILAIVIMTLL